MGLQIRVSWDFQKPTEAQTRKPRKPRKPGKAPETDKELGLMEELAQEKGTTSHLRCPSIRVTPWTLSYGPMNHWYAMS